MPNENRQNEVLAMILNGLGILGLGEMRLALEQLLAEPDDGATRLEWLWRLLEPQVRRRLEGRIESRIRQSRLPERKTFEAFDFSFQPSLDRDLIMELNTLRFLAQGKNILLAGMSGTGKSHIAKALALTACVDNRRVLYVTSALMLARLNASLADGTLARSLTPYIRAELLVIDEIGLEQVERKEASRSGLLQKVLLPRYNENRSTIVTSNIPWQAWADYLDDQLGATALLDRLIHRSHVIVINGPSWRDHEHRRETAEAKRSTEPPAATSKATTKRTTPSHATKNSPPRRQTKPSTQKPASRASPAAQKRAKGPRNRR